jgi:hypothetical protein
MELRKFIAKTIREYLNENINTCDLFKTNTTGMAYYDSILNNYKTYKHHPSNLNIKQEQVLFEILYLTKEDYFKLSNKTEGGMEKQKIDGIVKNMKNGVKYDLPMIDLIDGFQEGRHRVMAANILGCDKIPIAIFGTTYDINKTKRMLR